MILTCRGKVDMLGLKQDLKETTKLTRHIVSSKDPHLRTIFLEKESLPAKIIKNSGCFVLNFSEGKERECEKLDCFRLEGISLECEVHNIQELGDSIQITGLVVHEGTI
jgi:flavin reductase (DIM6/NTAB) family NADH-FMN oxidoreductase RutF